MEAVVRLRGHRKNEKGVYEYHVVWKGHGPDGKPHKDSWQPEGQVSSDLKQEYQAALLLIVTRVKTVCNIGPLLMLVRKSISHAVALAKTACRPRVRLSASMRRVCACSRAGACAKSGG